MVSNTITTQPIFCKCPTRSANKHANGNINKKYCGDNTFDVIRKVINTKQFAVTKWTGNCDAKVLFFGVVIVDDLMSLSTLLVVITIMDPRPMIRKSKISDVNIYEHKDLIRIKQAMNRMK